MAFNTSKIVNKISKKNSLLVILLLSLIALFVKVPLILFTEYLLSLANLSHINIFSSDTQIPEITKASFLLGVVYAPIVETLLAQTIPIKIGLHKGLSLGFVTVISSVIFGLMHLPVIAFVPGAAIVGLILALNYLAELKKGGGVRAYFSTTLLHALHNLYAFLITWLLASYS